MSIATAWHAWRAPARRAKLARLYEDRAEAALQILDAEDEVAITRFTSSIGTAATWLEGAKKRAARLERKIARLEQLLKESA